jgi:multiple sugar transport system substrate-binding protein
MLKAQTSRRNVLKGAAAAGAATALSATGVVGPNLQTSMAQEDVRTAILAIPGVGQGSPTEADMQKVGELCLDKTNIAEGEFAGVNLRFLGLNNQGLHNFIFRAFLAPWQEYTGAEIEWIDLAQADYNARLQQSIATGTLDFDVCEMGAPTSLLTLIWLPRGQRKATPASSRCRQPGSRCRQSPSS